MWVLSLKTNSIWETGQGIMSFYWGSCPQSPDILFTQTEKYSWRRPTYLAPGFYETSRFYTTYTPYTATAG